MDKLNGRTLQTQKVASLSLVKPKPISKFIYWPVAYGLRLAKDGCVNIGPETGVSCLMAVTSMREGGNPDYLIAPSAGRPSGDKWNGVALADLMRAYLIRQKIPISKMPVLIAKKPGIKHEAKEIALFLKKNKDFNNVGICVRWWYAPIAFCWLFLYLRKEGIHQSVKIKVRPCESFVDAKLIIRAVLVTYPLNALKMLLSGLLFYRDKKPDAKKRKNTLVR